MLARQLKFEHHFQKKQKLGKKVLSIILPAFVLLCYANAAERPLTVVSEGKSKAVIVVPSKASRAAAEGAKILQDHLQQISGASLKVLKESDLSDVKVVEGRIEPTSAKPAFEAFILVGEGELTTKLGQISKGLGQDSANQTQLLSKQSQRKRPKNWPVIPAKRASP